MTDLGLTAYTLLIPGEPRGWQRARVAHKQRRHFDDPKTVRGKADVVGAWMDAGQPRFPDGALAIDLEAVLERPQGHYRTDGTLNAAGARAPWPTKKPDADNLVKLVCDALNTKGYRDDAQIVRMTVTKRWANAAEPPHTRVTVRLLTAADVGLREVA